MTNSKINAKLKGKEKTTLEVTNDEKALIRRAMEYYLNHSPYCQDNHPNNKVEGFACFSYYEAEFKAITEAWLKKDFDNMVKGAKPIASGTLGQVMSQLNLLDKEGVLKHRSAKFLSEKQNRFLLTLVINDIEASVKEDEELAGFDPYGYTDDNFEIKFKAYKVSYNIGQAIVTITGEAVTWQAEDLDPTYTRTKEFTYRYDITKMFPGCTFPLRRFK